MTEVTPAPENEGPAAGGAHDLVRLEEGRRLSQSMLYDLQRRFYVDQGFGAWANGTVPAYITCNPLIADSYAEVVLGFLRDARVEGQLPIGATVPVIEAGSGSGRFGFLFLRRLASAIASSELADVHPLLVLTDFSDRKFEVWRRHPSLVPLIEAGLVDMAVLDAADPLDGDLAVAECSISELAEGVPRVLMANYVFDTIGQDAFAVRNGQVHELFPNVDAPARAGSRPTDLADLTITWKAHETGPDHFGDRDLDSLLEFYGDTLGDTTLLVPTAAVALMRWFQTLADTPSLVLAADKGYVHHNDLNRVPEPGIALHGGCFSLMVNFDGLGRVVERRGGTALHPVDRPASLVVAAYAFGLDHPLATAGAYERHIRERGPDDVFTQRMALSKSLEHLTLEEMVVVTRTHLGDSTVILEAFPRLLDLAPGASDSVRVDIQRLVRLVWDGHFPIGERTDLALCLGLLLSAIDCHREALLYFAESRERHGPSATTAFADAVARFALRDLDGALKAVDEALALEPGFSAARVLRTTIADEMAVAAPASASI